MLDAILDAEQLLELIVVDPVAAADELDRMADQLHSAAAELRKVSPRYSTAPSKDWVSDSGFSDRVMACVVGPDGKTKQYTDTERRS